MERKGRGMSGHNEERGTGRDPWETQPGRKEAEEPGVREEKRRLPQSEEENKDLQRPSGLTRC